MQTKHGRSARVRALLVLFHLCACATPELDVAEQALGSGVATSEETLLGDDFESGTVASPPWTTSGAVSVRVDAAKSGAFGVQLGRRAALAARFSTVGRRKLAIRFDARGVELDALEALVVEVALDDHRYLPIAFIRSDDWTRRTIWLPSAFENHEEVRLRFVVLASGRFGHERGFEGAHIDNVAVTAAASSVADAGEPDASLPDTGAPDASEPDAGGCVDDGACAALDQPCTRGVCDPATRACVSAPRAEGTRCGSDALCDDQARCLQCGTAAASASSTFGLVQANIFDATGHGCTSAVCHGASPGQGRLDLTSGRSYSQLIGVTSSASSLVRVQPGTPDDSFLYRKIAWGTNGTPVSGGGPMPAGGGPPVPARLLDGLGAWIRGGAPESGFTPGSVAALCTLPCESDAACSNGNACDGAELCRAGRCVAGSPLSCDDGVACTTDRCEPANGCVHANGPGLPCGEGGVCDASGACASCIPPDNTYDAIQARIFDSPLYVCTSCHRAGGRLVDLTAANSYAALLGQTGGRADVTPGNPETSILYDRLRAKIEGTPPVMGGTAMPRGNAPAITRDELSAIAAWISAGAPRTGLVPGTERALCVAPPPGDSGQLTTLWDFPTAKGVTSTPLVVGDTLYATSWEGAVYALDRATGAQRWRHDTKARAIQGGVARAADGSLLVGDGEAVIWKLDASGQVIWSRDLDVTGADHIWNTLTVTGDLVYVPISSHGDVPCTKGRTVALDLATGATVWSRMNVPAAGICRTDTAVECQTNADCPGAGACESAVGGAVTGRILLDPGGQSIYVNTVGCYTFPQVGDTDAIMKLDARTGAVQWLQRFSASEQFNYCEGSGADCRSADDCGGGACVPKSAFHDFGFINGPYLVSAPTAAGGTRPLLVSASKSGSMYALDPASGERLWTRAVLPAPVSPRFAGYGLFNGALAYENGRFFAALYEFVPPIAPAPNHLMAFSAVDGSTLWSDEIGKSWSSLTVSRGVLYAGTMTASEFYAYRSASGARLATYPLPTNTVAAPSVDGDTLYLGYGIATAGGVRAYRVR